MGWGRRGFIHSTYLFALKGSCHCSTQLSKHVSQVMRSTPRLMLRNFSNGNHACVVYFLWTRAIQCSSSQMRPLFYVSHICFLCREKKSRISVSMCHLQSLPGLIRCNTHLFYISHICFLCRKKKLRISLLMSLCHYLYFLSGLFCAIPHMAPYILHKLHPLFYRSYLCFRCRKKKSRISLLV